MAERAQTAINGLLEGAGNWPAVILASFILASFVFAAWRFLRRAWPVRADLSYLPLDGDGRDLGVKFTENTDGNAVGKIGEMITALMFVADGWRQLPSQPNGIHRLDGLFVKPGAFGGLQVAFVETKTSRDGDPARRYVEKPKRWLSREKIIADLEAYGEARFEVGPYMPDDLRNALTGGLQRSALSVKCYVYAHRLREARTEIYRLGADGALKGEPRVIGGAAHRELFRTLSISLARIIRFRPELAQGSTAMVETMTGSVGSSRTRRLMSRRSLWRA